MGRGNFNLGRHEYGFFLYLDEDEFQDQHDMVLFRVNLQAFLSRKFDVNIAMDWQDRDRLVIAKNRLVNFFLADNQTSIAVGFVLDELFIDLAYRHYYSYKKAIEEALRPYGDKVSYRKCAWTSGRYFEKETPLVAEWS